MGRKFIIGLTGNIATGKSLVLDMLRRVGAEAIDADKLVHELLARDTPVYHQVVEAFGRGILNEEGEIDRARLGGIVFADPRALKRLEALIHPAVGERLKERIAAANAGVVVIEAIKLIESGLVDLCDALWVVDAPEEVQLERLMIQRRMSRCEALLRIRSQPEQQAKRERADVVIDNSRDREHTWQQVQHWFAALPAPAGERGAVADGEENL